MIKRSVFPLTTYLNQNAVFDLLAVIEDGFSQVNNLNISNTEGKSTNSNVDGEAGFGMYGIKTKIKAAMGIEKSTTEEKTSSEERVHTPTSLFAKLFSYLEENDLIMEVNDTSDLEKLSHGSFVRFESKLERNPLISLLESFEQMMVVAMTFQSPQKSGKKNNEQEILKQIKSMKNSLTENDSFDLICTINKNESLKAVLPVYLNYFIHKNTNEIIDGNYTVFGKVVKIVSDDADDINLFRNTGFKLFQQEALDTMLDSMNNGTDEQLEIPNINSRISSPAILVIPIAIYS
ncbi:hypothetical protein BBI11_00655 [Planococcus maritimus]|uniref:DUF6414 family protein n=1 Tax=Planococcus maritimus TaxID=192421 RepID=UPI00080F32B4|nr:hypothetical protein [Planococcus maritimus]ANU15689.1 hypothetical protein BBI11_00655 [Planococcus maritimus]